MDSSREALKPDERGLGDAPPQSQGKLALALGVIAIALSLVLGSVYLISIRRLEREVARLSQQTEVFSRLVVRTQEQSQTLAQQASQAAANAQAAAQQRDLAKQDQSNSEAQAQLARQQAAAEQQAEEQRRATAQAAAARKALAAARNLREAGSLTVIATAAQPFGGETTVIALDAALTSTARQGTRRLPGGSTTACGAPSASAGYRERSVSWRSWIACSAARSAPSSTGPRSRSAAGLQ